MTDWRAFVRRHGVVLATAHGPVPSIGEAIAGGPIRGSWWGHPKGKLIFRALSTLDDDAGIACMKLVAGKLTFVHRRVWPALVRLGNARVIARDSLAVIRQEHTASGKHVNHVIGFPDWVDATTATAAKALSLDAARAELPWLSAGSARPSSRPARARSPRA
jgi:hypothetical protein